MESSPRKTVSQEELAVRFRRVGLKPTPQRMAVLEALLASDQHPSPERVFQEIRAEMPSISLATVYKTLDALREAGLIREVERLGERRRYDAWLDPHHHLVCKRCQRIQDVHDPALDGITLPEHLGGFEITEVQVHFLGICEACRGD